MFRIVLCDDSPADLMVLCGHLEQLKEKRPVDILSYTDGLDLLKDYKQKGFCDILVLDMRMETMGGIEVAKHIRQLDDEVPILIVTATVDYAVEGYKVVEGRSKRIFTDTKAVVSAAEAEGYTDIYKQELLTLTEFEKMMGKKKFVEILGQYVTKPPGKLALVPESDPRPAVDLSAAADEFEALE